MVQILSNRVITLSLSIAATPSRAGLPTSSAASEAGHCQHPAITRSNSLQASASAAEAVAGPGVAVRVRALRFGGESGGSSALGGSSEETTLKRSLLFLLTTRPALDGAV